MKKIRLAACLFAFLSFVFLPIAAHSQAAASHPKPSKKAQKLLALERQRFEAMVSRDFVFLRKVLADDLRYTHSNAKLESKAEYLTEITDGTLRYLKMEPQALDARFFGRRTAVITGTVYVSVKQGDRTVDSQLRYTDVWARRGGKWQLVAWQSARVP